MGLSYDGSTALVGVELADVGGNAQQGSAFVFVRQGSAWSQQAKLVDIVSGSQYAQFGSSVALSNDGNSALIGSDASGTPGGYHRASAWAFVRNGGTWSQQGQVANLADSWSTFYGTTVALSGDGGTALVGAELLRPVGDTSYRLGMVHIYGLPVRPALVSPADGATTGDSTPALTWQPSANAAAYRLDLDGSVVDVGTGTQYTPAALSPGPHTWRVVGVDALGNESPWSETWSFTIVEAGSIGRIYLPLVLR